MAMDPFVVGVARLRRQLGATVHTVVAGPFDPTGEMAPLAPGESYVPEGDDVSFDGVLECIPNGLVVRGAVTGRWRGLCRRCATKVGGPLEVTIRERYQEGASPEDDEAYPLEGEMVDLGPAVRDAIVLELPLAPLCSEDCKGICIECGADRNSTDCGCEAPIDPRWATLDTLRRSD
ncbi:MAG: DUF177 domain-containing protein [Actinomycetes bacterium]